MLCNIKCACYILVATVKRVTAVNVVIVALAPEVPSIT